MELKQILGVAGSLLLFVGVFVPIISMPIIGSLNYFQNGKGDGVIILVLALISLVLTLTRKYKALLITGLLSLAVMLFTFISFKMRINDMKNSLGDNPFAKGIADLALQTVQIQWGWAVLVIGACLIIAAAVVKNPSAYPAAERY